MIGFIALPVLGFPAYVRLLFFHRKSPEPADENIFAVLQGLPDQLKTGVDDPG
jgi:hypothetical protein